MPQGIQLAGGFGAGGVRDALVDLIAQRMAEQQFEEMKAQREQQAARQRMLDERALDETMYRRGRDIAEDQQRAADAANASVSVDTVDEEGNPVTRFMRPGEVQGQTFKKAVKKDQPKTMTIETVDPKTRRPVTRVLPEAEALGQSFEKYVAPKEPRAPRDERLVQIAGPNGTAVWVRESEAVGKPAAQAARSVTGGERQTLAFYNRGKEASDTLAAVDQSGKSLEERIATQNKAGQLWGALAPNLVQTEDQQLYRQAQRAFTEARLRKESGAAIPQGEYDTDARTYFAQPGDSPALIEQKRKARENVLEGLKFSAGKAFDEFYGESGPAGVGALGGKKDSMGIR